ncbi:colicin V family bacteriocin [Microcoleus sp. Pol12A5]|uniref:colicin V family bacteriocin n=1 Tax=Microcoleus sp. Pol12A5 TaxID=3055392 RepID=UPI002FCE94F0
MNDKQQSESDDKHLNDPQKNADNHPIATGLGAVGGGVAGAAIGNSVGGKVGAAIGSIAGAIAGGIAGNAVADVASEAIAEIQPASGLGLGANAKPVELPKHYNWEELQALSKPQG